MKIAFKDILSTLLAVFGGVVMFAKLESYSWWLIGSWKGALGVLAGVGVAIMLTNAVELWRLADGLSLLEVAAWITAATVVIANLFVTTTKAEFIWSGVAIGGAWLIQETRHLWKDVQVYRHHTVSSH